MTKEELQKLLKDASIEVIKNVLNDLPRRDSLEVAKDWYNNLEGVKFSDWNKDLFEYSIPIKEIKIPTKMFVDCFNKIKRSEHILINYLQRELNKIKNQFFLYGKRVKGYFIKLESRSPKDNIVDWDTNTYKALYNAEQMVDTLLGSMRTFEDLVLLTQLKDEVILYIRPFIYLEKRYEWRTFVKDKKVIGISQQFYKETFSYKEHYIDILEENILYFMNETCIPNIPIDNFVADLYVYNYFYLSNDAKFIMFPYIIETNPYGLSDPCLFETYDNLESSKELLKYNKQ